MDVERIVHSHYIDNEMTVAAELHDIDSTLSNVRTSPSYFC